MCEPSISKKKRNQISKLQTFHSVKKVKSRTSRTFRRSKVLFHASNLKIRFEGQTAGLLVDMRVHEACVWCVRACVCAPSPLLALMPNPFFPLCSFPPHPATQFRVTFPKGQQVIEMSEALSRTCGGSLISPCCCGALGGAGASLLLPPGDTLGAAAATY